MFQEHGVITSRDIEILRWLGRHGVVSTRQVADRYFPRSHAARPAGVATSAVYRRLRVLEGLKLIRRDQIYLRGSHVLRLTVRGARVAEVGVRPATLVIATVPHALAVVDLVERLLQENPGATAMTEREIRARQVQTRLASGGRTDMLLRRIPDALLRLPSGETVAIELDRTPKREVEVKRIARAYADHYKPTQLGADDAFTGIINRVWWYARTGRTAERVRKTVKDMGYAAFVDVRAWTS